MNITKFSYYLKKIHTLGAKKSISLIKNKLHTSLFEQYSRHKAEHKIAGSSWKHIAYQYELDTFKKFWKLQSQRSFIYSQDLYKKEKEDKETLLAQAASYANGCFSLLGSSDQCLINIDWHSDFRLRYQNPDADYLFDKNMFYRDFIITAGLTDRLTKDIKIPWELSRCTYFYVLGAAYEQGNNPLYAHAFYQYITDWITENSFLLGPNWVCPMDVGIRAFNWVWAFHFFKKAPELNELFWEQFTSSLYDHLCYLENNWELYEKTSNHYLGNLIGYYALTWFFKDLKGMEKKAAWCHKELLKECEKQIFEEGTDYEGSTAYHQLVTEMFYHFYLLAQEHGHTMPDFFIKKLHKMFSFLDWCSTAHGSLIKIGDDDSGKLLQYGITPELINAMKNKQTENSRFFKEFGLSIYKDERLHLTLRHHTYQTIQPSGHFHNDAGSITLAVDGIPVIVDPGSYVYTPSAFWRNTFRSVQAHNTFYIKDIEPILFNDKSLFFLDIPEKQLCLKQDPWVSKHTLYSTTASRTIKFETTNIITLIDQWSDATHHTFISCWNFTLAPDISAEYKNSIWTLSYQAKPLLTIFSEDIQLSLVDSWFAPEYGKKVSTKCLQASTTITSQPIKTKIMLL